MLFSKKMSIFEEAVVFAVQAHRGMTRKGGNTPYITHPLEAAAIAATLTDDEEILAAAVLHDVVEDTRYTSEDICKRFGERVAELVASDSENKREERPAEETWRVRKEETLALLKTASREEKIIVFADKLSNLRALHRDYLRVGEELWQRFNQKDPMEQLWYYGSFLDLLSDFADAPAYQEYARLFGELKEKVEEQKQEMRVAIETESGKTIWLTGSKAEAWKRGQELLKKGDPEALGRREQLRLELAKKLREL